MSQWNYEIAVLGKHLEPNPVVHSHRNNDKQDQCPKDKAQRPWTKQDRT